MALFLLASCTAVACSYDPPTVYIGLETGVSSHEHVENNPEISTETKMIDEENPLSIKEVEATLSDEIVSDGALSN